MFIREFRVVQSHLFHFHLIAIFKQEDILPTIGVGFLLMMVINIMSQQQIMNFILLLCCVLAPIFAENCTVEQYKCEVSGKCIGIDKICDGTKDLS